MCPQLAAQSWEIKRQAAAALATLAENAGNKQMNKVQHVHFYDLLILLFGIAQFLYLHSIKRFAIYMGSFWCV